MRRLVVITAFFLLYPQTSWATISVKPSSGPLYQGQPVELSVTIKEIRPLKAELFYRPMGVRTYQHIPVDVGDGETLTAVIPPTAVVTPGIEYYLKVVDISGRVITSPSVYAEFNPYTIGILPSSPLPEVNLISHDPSVPVRDVSGEIVLEITHRLPEERITVLVDGTDITPLAGVSGRRLSFPLELMADPGEHTLVVELRGEDGSRRERSWRLTIAGKEKMDKEDKTLEFYARGGVSMNYGKQLKSPSGSTDDSVSGNLNLEFGMKGRDWEMTWNGINIQYIKDSPGDDFTINSGFYFTLRKGEQFVEYGDITIRETQLTAPSFARRGVQAKLKGFGTEVHLFGVSTQTVSGWNSGIGGTDQQVYGLSIERSLFSGLLPLKVVYITGENQKVDGFNTSSINSPSKGDILGLTMSPAVYGVRIDGEIAGSRYDDDTTDSTGKKKDVAGTIGASTTIHGYSLSMGYYYYGPDFSSIANPNFTTDREGFSGGVSTTIGPSNISLSLNRGWDNVEGNPSRAIVYSTSLTLACGLTPPPPLPGVNISYTRSVQDSVKEPVGTQEVKNTNDTVNLGLSFSGKGWSASAGGNYGRLNDEVGGLDSETRGFNLSGSLTPFEGLSLSPAFNFTESKASDVLKTTRIASLTASIPLWSPYADTSFQVSYTSSSASDGSQDSTDLNGSWRLSVNIHEFLKKWIDYGTEMLALSASYSKIDDKVSPSNSGEDISVFLSINLFAPLELSGGL